MLHEDRAMRAVDGDSDGGLTVFLARAQRVRRRLAPSSNLTKPDGGRRSVRRGTGISFGHESDRWHLYGGVSALGTNGVVHLATTGCHEVWHSSCGGEKAKNTQRVHGVHCHDQRSDTPKWIVLPTRTRRTTSRTFQYFDSFRYCGSFGSI